MRELDAMAEVDESSLFGTTVHAVLKNAGIGASGLADRLRHAGLPIDSIDPVQPSLEDVFLDVVEKAARP